MPRFRILQLTVTLDVQVGTPSATFRCPASGHVVTPRWTSEPQGDLVWWACPLHDALGRTPDAPDYDATNPQQHIAQIER